MSVGQRMRAMPSLVRVPHTPAPVTPIASVEADWDDDVVDFQNDRTDDTVNVAVASLEAAAAAEKQAMTDDIQAPKVETGAELGHATNGVTAHAPAPLPVMIRIAANGAVVANKGGSEELAGVVAYAHRLIELVGDMLGLERFMAVECAFKAEREAGVGGGGRAAGQERCLLFAEENGDTVLVRPRAEGDLRALRETLGL